MGNVLLSIDMITNEALRVLENELVVTRTVNRQYDASFAKSGAKIGSTLRIRKPDRATVTDGPTIATQDENQQWTTLTVSSQKNISMSFSSAERTMTLDNFSDLIIKPRMSQLAASIDYDVANGVARYINQVVGTPGTTPSTSQVLLAGMQKLDEAAVPRSDRYCTVNPAANAALVEGLKGLFNPGSTISDQFKSGLMGTGVLGIKEIAMSQSIGSLTTGTRTAGATLTTTVAAQGQTTLAITTNGATDTIKAGDVFTLANVYAVNPQTRVSTGALFQFVALADATAVGNAVTVTVPAIYWGPTQALATMDSVPTAAAAVTWVGGASLAYPQNLIYHKDAITFATADLEFIGGGVESSRAMYNGMSIRVSNGGDIVNDRRITRLDVLYGYGVIRPEMVCRLVG